MRNPVRVVIVASILFATLPTAALSAQTAPAAQASANAEDQRLTAFLDQEFATELKFRPQLATRLGEKEGKDRLDDISDEEWELTFKVNIHAMFYLTKAAVPHMKTSSAK